MDRNRRNSVHSNSNNMVLSALRDKIKSVEDSAGQKMDLIDPLRFGAVIHMEQILINKKPRSVRRAYMFEHRYKVGWVVDWDINVCMICSQTFGWILGRPKHHCRACGALVCHACSPYTTTIPGLNEAGGSRVCADCFGLKPNVNSPINTPTQSPKNSFSHAYSPNHLLASSSPSTMSPLPAGVAPSTSGGAGGFGVKKGTKEGSFSSAGSGAVHGTGAPGAGAGVSFSSSSSAAAAGASVGGISGVNGVVRRPKSSRTKAVDALKYDPEADINEQMMLYEKEQEQYYYQDYL
jgi:hypothetical protein